MKEVSIMEVTEGSESLKLSEVAVSRSFHQSSEQGNVNFKVFLKRDSFKGIVLSSPFA